MSGFDAETLRARHRDLEIEVVESDGSETVVRVPGAHARKLLARLLEPAPEPGDGQEDEGVGCLVDLTAIDRGMDRGIDRGRATHRFEVVYRLRSAAGGPGLRIHALVAEDADTQQPVIDSVTALWPAADWLEREVLDLFGIRFRGHPDPRRILLEESFVGAPLRRDHALRLDRALPAEETS